jgi:hypothetical protein
VKLGKKATQNAAIADWQAQEQNKLLDKQTAENRPNQNTPWGSINWTQDDKGNWTQNVSLSPAEQAALDSQQRIKQGMSGIAEGMVGGIGDMYSNPMDWSQFTQRGDVVKAPGMGDYRDLGMIDPGALAAMGGGATAGSAGAGQASVERAKEYELQKKLDLEGLSALPEADAETRKRVEDAMYQQARSRLDPMQEQRRREQLDRLYAMGGREGDEVFGREQGNLERGITDENQQAIWNSIKGGGEEMQRLFDMGMSRRQQDFGERLQSGEFGNKALMDQFQQGAFNAGESNRASIANAGYATQAGIANAGNATQASIANASNRLQGYGMGLDYNVKSAGNWNDLVNQAYGNQRQSWQDTNATREMEIQDALRQRQQPLTELGGLLSGMGIGNPQFEGFSQAGQGQAGDIYGAYQDAQAYRQAQANSKNQMLGSMAGSAMGMFGFSDRRLKSNIARIGTTPGGYGWYEYDIFGRREQGVMADEVPAEWTTTHPSGYLMVDYGKVR